MNVSKIAFGGYYYVQARNPQQAEELSQHAKAHEPEIKRVVASPERDKAYLLTSEAQNSPKDRFMLTTICEKAGVDQTSIFDATKNDD